MKQLKFLAIAATALLAAATLSFTSCSDDDDEPGTETTFNVSPSSLTFDAAGGTKTLTVTGDWDKNPTTEADWLTLTTADNKITVVATAYTETTAPRTTTITVGSKTVNVSQAAYVAPTPSVTANPSSLSFNASNNSPQTVYVTLSNVEGSWTATESADWVTVTPNTSNNTFTVNVNDNDGSARTATITVKVTDDVKTTVSVSQKGAGVSSMPQLNGTYTTVSGTPNFRGQLSGGQAGASSFTGNISTAEGQDVGDSVLWDMYELSNFGGEFTLPVYIRYLDGYFVVPDMLKVCQATAENGTIYYGFLTAIAVDWNTETLYTFTDYTAEWDSVTNQFDFSYTTEDGLVAMIGVLALDANGNYGGVFTDMYEDLVLSVTTTKSGENQISMSGKKRDLSALGLEKIQLENTTNFSVSRILK